mmetsp:Transcript_43039/g.107087  ORF Transcript_43039/g.107087 Transcript_43039/m.107087 type:complete len:201 (+) Transcript_43039:716-1318(+)
MVLSRVSISCKCVANMAFMPFASSHSRSATPRAAPSRVEVPRPISSSMINDLCPHSLVSTCKSSISCANDDFPSDGTSNDAVRTKYPSYRGTSPPWTGASSPAFARSATTVVERINVDFPAMLGAVSIQIPFHVKEFLAAACSGIQYGQIPSTFNCRVLSSASRRTGNVHPLAMVHLTWSKSVLLSSVQCAVVTSVGNSP